MLSSASCGMAATGATLSKVRPWPACGSMPFSAASAAQLCEAIELGFELAALRSRRCMRVAAGVEFDDGRAEPHRSFDLSLVRLDEQADADVRGAELVDIVSEVVVLARRVEAALRRTFLAPLGDDAGGVGPVGEGDRQHLLGRRHLEVQRQVDLGHQPVDVLVGDVAPVLAQVGGDAVGAGVGGDVRRAHGIRMCPAARVPDGRDMVDIDAEAEASGHAAARLPGLIGGIAASSGGTASAS